MTRTRLAQRRLKRWDWDPLLIFSAEFNSLGRARIVIATHRYHLTSAARFPSHSARTAHVVTTKSWD